MTISFIPDGSPLERALDGLSRSLAVGFARQMKRADTTIAKDLRGTFARGGPEGGEAWDAPSESTLRHRLKSHTPPALTDRGGLRESIAGEGSSGGRFAVREVGAFGLFRGTDRADAATHNKGRGNIPQREFALVSDRAEEEILEGFVSEIERRVQLCQRGSL